VTPAVASRAREVASGVRTGDSGKTASLAEGRRSGGDGAAGTPPAMRVWAARARATPVGTGPPGTLPLVEPCAAAAVTACPAARRAGQKVERDRALGPPAGRSRIATIRFCRLPRLPVAPVDSRIAPASRVATDHASAGCPAPSLARTRARHPSFPSSASEIACATSARPRK
jgi:hypothetical protein